MKTKVFFAFLLTLALCGCQKSNDLKVLALNGPVKSIKSNVYAALITESGDVTKGEQLRWRFWENQFCTFNTQGNKTLEYWCYSENEVESKYIYSYDENGVRIGMHRYTPEGDLIISSNYKYNRRGNRIEMNRFDNKGNFVCKFYFKYDMNDHIKEQTQFDAKGNFLTRYEYEIDKNGDQKEMKQYNAKNELENRYVFTYTYDSLANWVTRTAYVNGVPTYYMERKIQYYSDNDTSISNEEDTNTAVWQ